MNATIYDESKLFAKTRDNRWWYIGSKTIAFDEFGIRYRHEIGDTFRDYTDFFGTEMLENNVQIDTKKPKVKSSPEYRDAHKADWDLQLLQDFLANKKLPDVYRFRSLLKGYLPNYYQITEFQTVHYHTGSGFHADSTIPPKVISITADNAEIVLDADIEIADAPLHEGFEFRTIYLFAENEQGETVEIDCCNIFPELTDISDPKWMNGRLAEQYTDFVAKKFTLAIERYGKEIPYAFQPVVKALMP